MTREQQIAGAVEDIKNAFKNFAYARGHLTLWEFRDAIAGHIRECGGKGFVESVGEAIVGAARDKTITPETQTEKNTNDFK